jgi:hypothetical protein
MTVLSTVDRRVLGAFQCVDAITRLPVSDRVLASTAELDLRSKANGVFVVFAAPGMRALTTQFEPKLPWPASTPFIVSLKSAGGRYLPRVASIAVPRSPTAMNDPSSSMIPQSVTLYPSPAAIPGANWAVVRASVTRGASRNGIAWAVLRLVRDSDDAVLATAMSGLNGEALLAVPGIGVTSNPNGGGAVMTATIDATVTAFVSPDALSGVAADPGWLPNPDDVLNDLANAGLKKNSQAVKIGRGTLSHVTLPIAV